MDDSLAAEALKAAWKGRELLLIAPGKSVITERERIGKYIAEKNPVVIGVNAMVSDYEYDYVFYVNPARYDYARTTMKERFDASKHILTSNIASEADDRAYVISYNHVIKRGWDHFDNAVICALRMLDWMGMEAVAIAGFDGFKTKYNESYADSSLPTLNPDNKWDELNDEIKDIYRDLYLSVSAHMKITFLTESIFETHI